MIEEKRIEEKKQRLLALLEKGVAQVHVDARRPGVLLPQKFRNDMQVALNLSYKYQPPDLTVNQWGIRETLSFGGNTFKVALPWSSVFAIGSAAGGDFFMYPDELPLEMMLSAVAKDAASVVKTTERAPEGPTLVEPTSAKIARSPLRAVATDASAAPAPKAPEAGTASTSTDPERPEPPTPNRSHLRIVK